VSFAREKANRRGEFGDGDGNWKWFQQHASDVELVKMDRATEQNNKHIGNAFQLLRL